MKKYLPFLRTSVIAAGLLALTACSNLDDTQQKMLSGAAAGAAIGTVGTVITGGCVPCGTVIGGAVGAGTGYVLKEMDKNTKSDSSSSAPSNASGGGYGSSGGGY